MGLTDAIFTTASKKSPHNSLTLGLATTDQTKVSDFLTVQSLTNFAAMTGAITVAWKALEAVNASWFGLRWTPLVMAFLWFLVSLVASVAQLDPPERWNLGYWAPAVFIGIVNALVLFAAVIGLA